MNYTHLAREERYQIATLLKAGHSQRQIAELLQRHPATISRELARSGCPPKYCPRRAQASAQSRRQRCANAPRIDAQCWEIAQARLQEGWSPSGIAGRLRCEGRAISHETIYRRVYADKRHGGVLWRHLRCQKPHRKRYGRYDRRGRARPLGGVPIEARPAVIETRATFGHWEGDTMLDSGMRSALVTLVERKSRYTLLARVERKTAALVGQAVIQLLRPFGALAQTLTVDNGKEFSGHADLAARLNLNCYFARPYAAWQRGSVENTNGLLRQYFPRNRPIASIPTREIRQAMDKLNHRPRKCLGYRTPHEVMTEALQTVALRA